MTESLLAPWVGDVRDFFAAHWRRHPAVFTPDPAPAPPLTLEDVDTALATGFLRTPYAEMWADGKMLSGRHYTTSRTVARDKPDGFVDTGKIGTLLDEGATLLLRSLDQWHAPTREFITALAQEMGRPIESFCFITPAGSPGLPLHRDDADVLVLQIAGSKRWAVHEGPAGADWHAGRITADEPQPAQIADHVLSPGHVLYVPRGFAHRATGQEGLSVHLSLTVREVATADLSAALGEGIGEGVTRQRLPLSDQDVEDTAAALLDAARHRLDALTPKDLVELARRARIDRMPTAAEPLSLTALGGSAPPGTPPLS
ncbi:JmjC domain-containing protein [Streptomyces sp. NBC_00859]|uniref:JmjC domain-containing protein n=1 Tax=Streptomyces sp. NBC_00859 TaxID=2903682 RepID=UPI00386C84E7|nr:cupin domain-containing protein [Streptomyces sp. NBC_00859]WSZ86727.1 cupin domain-containing protein [Streptomyces sp. NBC_00859]